MSTDTAIRDMMGKKTGTSIRAAQNEMLMKTYIQDQNDQDHPPSLIYLITMMRTGDR